MIFRIVHRIMRLSPLRVLVSSSSKTGTRGSNIDNRLGWVSPITTWTGDANSGPCNVSHTKSLQKQIVHTLLRGERHRASDLLSKLIKENHLLQANDFSDILYYCADSIDPLFVMETYSAMSEKGISLDSKSWELIIRALCKGGYFDQAFQIVHFSVEDDSVSPVLPLYNCFLGACAKAENLLYASKCMDLMKSKRAGKNEITYTHLLHLAVLQRNLSDVEELWKEYVKSDGTSIICLSKFIWAFSRLGDLNSTYQILQHMIDLVVRGNVFVKFYNGRLISSTSETPTPSHVATTMDTYGSNLETCNMSETKSDIDFVQKNNGIRNILTWSFNEVFYACGKAKNSELAEQLMLQMENLGLQPSSYTYDGFIQAVVHKGGYEYGMEVLKLMQQKNLKPYKSTLSSLSAHCSKALQVDLAEFLLDQCSECSHRHPYNKLLAACLALDQPERAIRVLAKLIESKLGPDIRTYELLFQLFGNVNAPYEDGNIESQKDCAKRIRAIELDMIRNGVQHSHNSMINLLRAYGTEGMLREVINYSQAAVNFCNDSDNDSDVNPKTSIYNIVLHSLVTEKSKMAIDLFRRVRYSGISVNVVTYSIMINYCSYIHSYISACALVSLMIRDGCPRNAIIFTILIKILSNDGNFEEAISLLDQAALEEIQLDSSAYNNILRKACEKGRIDVIEYIVAHMHHNRVSPDPTTCHFVFTAYIKENYHTTACEALNILSLRMMGGEESERLREKRRELEENFIHTEDPEAESNIINMLNNSEEHYVAMLLNLRWCAILGLQVLWSEDQSSWARRLADNYVVFR